MTQLPTIRQGFSAACAIGPDASLRVRIDRVLVSAPICAIRSLLDPIGCKIERTPIVHKYLTQQHLRLMFPVSGGMIQNGTVASIVCLYDCDAAETLYAHPMHAGPNVNPLLKHPDGPMASPKAQPGRDGDRATTRMIAHKEALWIRFCQDLDTLGSEEASARWRRGYYWALKRLYFCTRCTSCRWGTPFFDGPDPDAPPKGKTQLVSSAAAALTPLHAGAVAAVVSSEVWKIEQAYALRGGFIVSQRPRVIRDLGGGFLQLLFPTNAGLIEGGTLVAVSVTYSTLREETVFAHCLSVGPEAEIQFLLGDEALGLPPPCADVSVARAGYVAWRKEGWSRFWLEELDDGIGIASKRWLKDFWLAIQDLFGGNDLAISFEALPAITLQENRVRTVIPLETLQNTGMTCFAGHAAHSGLPELRATELSTLMVNLGRRCNQSCGHCHIDAGPNRTEEMDRATVDMVIAVLRRHDIDTLDITGGAPEMNPHFRHLASAASELCDRVVDRCNLTILLEPGHEDLAGFLARHGIVITASLPFYHADAVDRQRGLGTFEKSIEALKMLNALGYGDPGTERVLNLVYNPIGTDLASSQNELEERFKGDLRDQHGVVFNRLFAMNNMPVNRFRDQLVREGNLESYMNKLVGAFNPATADGFMCRNSLSVGWDGQLHDCDFNQACAMPLSDGNPSHIRDFEASMLRKRTINTAAHCFACAAGAGSSCNGALASTPGLRDVRRNGHRQPGVASNMQVTREPA